MLKKTISFVLVGLMINVTFAGFAIAGNSGDTNLTKSERKIRKHAYKIQKGVEKLGVSKDSKVKVKLRDKTKIEGYISDVGSEDFTVVDQMGTSHVIKYTSAKQIKGNNLHTGVWIGIGVGAAVIVMLIILGQLIDD